MIDSFEDSVTEDVYHGRFSKKVRMVLSRELFEICQKKLDMLDAAFQLEDLKVPPGNRLETLQGNLKGMHSIRINNQWRIVFQWTSGNAAKVKIMDYHRG